VASLMTDRTLGLIREDILNEKILSAIVEIKAPIERVPAVLQSIKNLAREVDTVISVGVSTRCDSAGNDLLGEVLEREGYPAYRGKTNLGLGHASAMRNSPNAEARK
jgi:hypothetical protein